MKKYSKLLIIAISSFALIACSQGIQKDNYPQALTDENVNFKMRSGFDGSRIDKTEAKTFRTFTIVDDTTVREIAGSNCSMTSSEFHVKFAAPATVNVPLVKGKPSPMQISCSNGALKYNQTTEPFIHQSQVYGGYSGGGIAGALFGLAIEGALTEAANASRRNADIWRYVPLAIEEIPIKME